MLGHGASIITEGLVLCLDAANPKSYPGSGTTWSDLSGNGNNGTLTNGPTYDSGNGGSLVFDGVDDYTNLGTLNLLPTGIGTVSAFVKISKNGNNYFIAKGHDATAGSWGITFNPSLLTTAKVYFLYGYASWVATQSFPFSPQLYYYVTAVANSNNTQKIYINGEEQPLDPSNLGNKTVITPVSSNGFAIGKQPRVDPYGYYAGGNISQLTIHNRALSAAEIQQNFNALRGRYGI